MSEPALNAAAVGIPVGPGETELRRLGDATASLRLHVGDAATLLLIDDAPEPRDLAAATAWDPARLVIRRTRRPDGYGHPNDYMSAGSVEMLAWLAQSDCTYLVKLDTDALVIGDFRPSIEAAIASAPEVGIWGAHRHNQLGDAGRDFAPWRPQLVMAISPLRARINPRSRLRVTFQPAISGQAARSRRAVTRLLVCALRNGYVPGEHCLGGSYAVMAAAACAMAERGFLSDPLLSYRTHLSEDVVVGLLARACGYRLGDLIAPGDAFAVQHRGLPAPPVQLLERRHSIVHSLRGDASLSEDDLREWFRQARCTQTLNTEVAAHVHSD